MLQTEDDRCQPAAQERADQVQPQVAQRAAARDRTPQDRARPDGRIEGSAGDPTAREGADHDGEADRQTEVGVARCLVGRRRVQDDQREREGEEDLD